MTNVFKLYKLLVLSYFPKGKIPSEPIGKPSHLENYSLSLFLAKKKKKKLSATSSPLLVGKSEIWNKIKMFCTS